MNETIKMIIYYILQWGPSIVSIITMICTVLVAIKQVKNSTSSNLEETKRMSTNTALLMKENAELKKEIRKLLRKTYKVKDTEE